MALLMLMKRKEDWDTVPGYQIAKPAFRGHKLFLPGPDPPRRFPGTHQQCCPSVIGLRGNSPGPNATTAPQPSALVRLSPNSMSAKLGPSRNITVNAIRGRAFTGNRHDGRLDRGHAPVESFEIHSP